jgi:hypothetical protein
MKFTIEIPAYNLDRGIAYKWEKNFEIKTEVNGGAIIISANTEGLISLANHFLNLAQKNVPNNCHMHFDDNNSLEAGSVELIVQKVIV